MDYIECDHPLIMWLTMFDTHDTRINEYCPTEDVNAAINVHRASLAHTPPERMNAAIAMAVWREMSQYKKDKFVCMYHATRQGP